MKDQTSHYAIVIGIDRYPQLPNIKGAVESAALYRQWLVAPEGGALSEGNVHYWVSTPELPANPLEAKPNRWDIEDALMKVISGQGEPIGSRLYFYFAGQACGSSLNNVLLLMANASLDHLSESISLPSLREVLQRGVFEEIIYVLDCAFIQSNSPVNTAGLGFPLDSELRRTSGKEFILMTSGRVLSSGLPEVSSGSRVGLLTTVVLEGLQGGAASSIGVNVIDGVPERGITAVSLSEYVRAGIRDRVTGPKLSQLPEMLLPNGDILLSKVSISLLSGTLIVEVPHWSANVNIYNNLLQLVAGPLEVKASPGQDNVYCAEIKLPEGIYKVDVSLEGESESQFILAQFNRKVTIQKDSWKNLQFVSAAPLKGTASTHEHHMEAAKKWSRTVTWTHSPGKAERLSRLFLFVRTDEPKKYPRFAEGLRLLDATGELVTDFAEGVKHDKRQGWFAFCADLKPGYYILRRGRSGVWLRQQPVYLCKDWETQIFLQAQATPSLRTQAVCMAPKGIGFESDDESAIAAEAVVDSMRYGGSIKHLVSKEKIALLLRAKQTNPWLGVLAAYVLRSQLQEQPEENDQDSQTLLDHVMTFLDQIQDHPDVRALKLDMQQPSPEPFPVPPLLIKGLKLVLQHSLTFPETVPEGSLTDIVLENLVVNSPWTAWRELEEQPRTDDVDQSLISRHVERVFSGRALNRATRVIQSSAPKAPVLRVDDVVSEGKKSTAAKTSKSQWTSLSVNSIEDAQLLNVVQELTNVPDLDALPETVTLNEEKQASKLLDRLKPTEISEAFGLSLAHTENAVRRLREATNAKTATAGGSSGEAELRHFDKAVLEYALAESATAMDMPPGEFTFGHSPPISIEESVAAIRGEASRLLLPPEGQQSGEDSDAHAASENIGSRLIELADSLLAKAAFTVTTDVRGHILFCNRAFISLLTSVDQSLKPAERERKKKANYKAWEKVLKDIPVGSSMLTNPVAGVTPTEFRVWRTAIRQEGSDKPKAYLNTLKGKDSSAVSAATLEQIAELLPDLTRSASFFWYDPSERSTYASKLEDLTTKLQMTIGVTTNDPQA